MLVPYVVSGALGLAGLTLAIHLGSAPDPYAPSSGLVIAVGFIVFTVIAASGLMINRGKWARVLALIICVCTLALVVVTELGPWSIAATSAALAALFGLSGRWLSGWIRPRPSATGPGTKVVTLTLGLLALVPMVGAASPSGLETGHGILGAAAVLLTWGYAKAQPWALWALRLALPVAAIPAILAGPPAGSAVLAIVVAALTLLAWSEEARLAVTPAFERPPGPRHGKARPSGTAADT